MKKMRWIDLFQTIRRTKASWIAIVIFFLTSVSFNFGLTWSDDMLVNSFNQAYLDSHTRDVELFSFYGLDEEDLEEIRAIDEVSEAEGLRFASADLKHEGNRQRVSVRELSNDIDRLTLVEGDLPAEPDEVVMDRGWAERNGIRVGDRIELFDDGTNIGKVEYSDLTVCGLATNPAYSCAVAGTYGRDITTGNDVDVMLYGRKELFPDSDAPYQVVLITGDRFFDLRFDSQEYGDRCEDLADAVREKAGEIDRAKYDRISEMLKLTGQEEIPYVEGFVQTRSALFKLVSVNLITDIVSKTGSCLSLMFLLIALLVSYVAITRMVYLQTVQIGMKKSFGFTVFEIVRFYISYTVLALLIGSVVGGALGILFEYILGGSLTSVYYIDEVLLYYDIAEWIRLFLILLAIVIAITVGAVITICRRDAVDLLKQTEASAVKHNRYEKLPVWKRLSLLNRTIIKNCTTDKRRVFGTLISVSCCMALFVCAVTFYYNVKYSINAQFGRYFHFDIHIAFDEKEEGALESIRERLDEKQLRALPALLKLVSVESKDHKYTQAIVYVVDPAEADGFIDMKGYDTPDTAPFLDGVYAGHAYRSYYGEDSGSMTMYTGDGSKVEITPDGYFLNHMLSEMIFLSADRYRELFDEEPLPNAFLVQSDGVPLKEIRADLADIPGFYVCEDFIARCSQEFQAFIVFVTAVSAIYIVVAIVMVFLVLKNILSQFVLEKKKELIVMKINGYEDKEARRYILFDTILLTLIGIVPGAVLGSVAGYYAVCSFDSPTISLLKDPVWISWVIGIAATFLLSLLNCLSAMKQIDRFDISDISAS